MAEKKINMTEFRKMVKAGKTTKELMTKFKLKSSQSVKSALLSLIMKDQVVYNIKGVGKKMSSGVKFGAQGVRLSPQRLKSLGFKRGDKLGIEKKKGYAVIKKI